MFLKSVFYINLFLFLFNLIMFVVAILMDFMFSAIRSDTYYKNIFIEFLYILYGLFLVSMLASFLNHRFVHRKCMYIMFLYCVTIFIFSYWGTNMNSMFNLITFVFSFVTLFIICKHILEK